MKIFEQENFIPDYECKHLLWYQKNNASNDTSKWSDKNNDWTSRTVSLDSLRVDSYTREIVEAIHYRCCIALGKFYDIDVVYPEYNNLVYWREGMDMKPHADNTYIDAPHERHYCPQRDYAGILYLNDEYEGGHTYFPDHNYEVQPKTGKILMFSAGVDDIHGVTKVTKGHRYTMALWFTKKREFLFKLNE